MGVKDEGRRNQGSGHFLPFPKEAKGAKSTEGPPRNNSKGPSLGKITMHEEGYIFFKATGINFIILPRGEQELYKVATKSENQAKR